MEHARAHNGTGSSRSAEDERAGAVTAPDSTTEEQLASGNAGGIVVRIGATVRKRWTASTPAVHAFMDAVRARGVDLPRPLGRDERGRQVLEFVPGPLALTAPRLTRPELARVGALVRSIHDASRDLVLPGDPVWETVIPAPGSALICHQDLAPWNLVLGERWVFIDWDGAGPSTRLWDLAYSAQAFTLNHPDRPVEDSAMDLAAFADGYGASAQLRRDLPEAMIERTTAMRELLRSAHESGREPWATMEVQGHGAHWSAVVDHVRRHRGIWERALSPGWSPADDR